MSIAHAIQGASSGEFAAATITASVISLVCFWSCWHYWKQARRIQDTPTSKLRSAAQGNIELEGIGYMLPGDEIRSPASGDRCLWWEYSVHTQASGRKGMQMIRSARSDEQFGFKDDTGTCFVDPTGAKIRSNFSRSWRGNSLQSKPPPRALRSNVVFGSGRYLFKEKLITVGSPIYVLGWFESIRLTGAQASNAEQVRERLTQWKRDPAKMASFDTNQDGEVDAEEWDAARDLAKKQVQSENLAVAEHMAADLLFCPPRGQGSFIISTLGQADQAKRDLGIAFACLVSSLSLGALVTGACVIRGLI